MPMTTAVATYQYRTSRVAFGTFFLLLGAAFLLDSIGAFPPAGLGRVCENPGNGGGGEAALPGRR